MEFGRWPRQSIWCCFKNESAWSDTPVRRCFTPMTSVRDGPRCFRTSSFGISTSATTVALRGARSDVCQNDLLHRLRPIAQGGRCHEVGAEESRQGKAIGQVEVTQRTDGDVQVLDIEIGSKRLFLYPPRDHFR